MEEAQRHFEAKLVTMDQVITIVPCKALEGTGLHYTSLKGMGIHYGVH